MVLHRVRWNSAIYFLFRKLMDRLPPLIIYWWFVVGFNGIISAYGAAVYIAACPDFLEPQIL